MSVVTETPGSLAVPFNPGLVCTGMLVTEGYVAVYEVAIHLHPRPTDGVVSETRHASYRRSRLSSSACEQEQYVPLAGAELRMQSVQIDI